MEKLGYSWIHLDTQSYQTMATYLAPSNFQLSRGVRQGRHLSLLLYIINGQVLNLNIKLNGKIVGYPIPNQKEPVKLS